MSQRVHFYLEESVLQAIDDEAKKLERSRNWVVSKVLSERFGLPTAQRIQRGPGNGLDESDVSSPGSPHFHQATSRSNRRSVAEPARKPPPIPPEVAAVVKPASQVPQRALCRCSKRDEFRSLAGWICRNCGEATRL